MVGTRGKPRRVNSRHEKGEIFVNQSQFEHGSKSFGNSFHIGIRQLSEAANKPLGGNRADLKGVGDRTLIKSVCGIWIESDQPVPALKSLLPSRNRYDHSKRQNAHGHPG